MAIEDESSGFYTVMAYELPGGGQTAIPHFANPNIAYGGRPTGVVDEADNARSMNQTAQIVASFREYASSQKADVGASNEVLGIPLQDARSSGREAP